MPRKKATDSPKMPKLNSTKINKMVGRALVEEINKGKKLSLPVKGPKTTAKNRFRRGADLREQKVRVPRKKPSARGR